jgi:hypothetical protein
MGHVAEQGAAADRFAPKTLAILEGDAALAAAELNRRAFREIAPRCEKARALSACLVALPHFQAATMTAYLGVRK